MAGGIVDVGNARDAARRDSWAAACEKLRALDPAQMAPPDLEALADAAWWLSRPDEQCLHELPLFSWPGSCEPGTAGKVTSQLRKAYLP